MHPILQLVPASQQHMVGIGAALALATGGVLWLTGVRTARPLAAVTLAAVGGLAGVAHGHTLQMSPLAGALAGVALGLMLGFLLFRAGQALLVGAAVGLIAGAAFYATNVFPTSTLAHETLATPPSTWNDVWSLAQAEYASIPAHPREKLAIATVGGAILAFVVALAFPKPTTILGSSAIGTALMTVSLALLMALYGTPQNLPQTPAAQGITAVSLFVFGALVQWRIAASRADKSSQTPRHAASAAPVPA